MVFWTLTNCRLQDSSKDKLGNGRGDSFIKQVTSGLTGGVAALGTVRVYENPRLVWLAQYLFQSNAYEHGRVRVRNGDLVVPETELG